MTPQTGENINEGLEERDGGLEEERWWIVDCICVLTEES